MKKSKPLLLAVAICAAMQAQAQQASLQETKIESSDKSTDLLDVFSLDANTIDTQMVQDIQDTVRYVPGVQVSDTGNRFGDNGFNIRGMDGDSVAITIDGLSQGESLNPLSFSRYGMYSSTRNSIEVESVKSVQVFKGANSVLAGSGALGGAVVYTTKDADDYLKPEGNDTGGAIKTGYDGRSDEWLVNAALANRSGNFESLVVITHRDGSETKAYPDGADINGPTRGQADSQNREQNNLLVKLGYQSGAHNFGVVFEDYTKEAQGTPESRDSSTYHDFITDDESARERIGISYEWQADTALFDSLSASLDTQEIYTKGVTQFLYTSNGATIMREENRDYTQDLTKFSIDFDKEIKGDNTTHNLVYGLAIEEREVKNTLFDIRYDGTNDSAPLLDGYPIRDANWVPVTETTQLTAYVADRISLGKRFDILLGLRYDDTEYSPKVDENFTDSAGVVGDSEFSAFASNIAVEYEFIDNHSLIASVGQGYKAPTTQQLYLGTNESGEFTDSVRVEDSITGGVTYAGTGVTAPDWDTVSSSDLKAEKAINYELAYRFEGARGYVEVRGFLSDFSDFIVNEVRNRPLDTALLSASRVSSFVNPACSAAVVGDDCWNVTTITSDEYYVPTNAGEVSVSGIELEAAYRATDNLTLTFAYSHADGEYENTITALAEDGSVVEEIQTAGDPLESVAPDSAVFGVNYHGGDRWGLNAYARWIDAKAEEESFNAIYYSNKVTLVDLQSYFNITKDLTVRAGITNLFDEEYFPWERVRNVREGGGGFFGGVSEDGIDRFTVSGREFQVSLNYQF
ncbi:TonB-dependent hemoglobin/transferrin/lactoferrin family receptor [Gilvimarinus polysaccharolyticus]|uniref:TonB-dependent hemoglobin/transferrin/lactoferrin family receptor n=1 Tax=Gilvimarinus polysaccharolyticus TaxID=863921 RepID=UPI0006737B6B|nr:TonB-dependent hemoglobin/transferrin/lactoferrin family receptor [Gilvimarinus polysaccharolyticus]